MRFTVFLFLILLTACGEKTEQAQQDATPSEAKTIPTPSQTLQVNQAQIDRTKMGPAETMVQAQLDAYNARDIDAFMKCYADDVKVYAYPDLFTYEGKEKMYNLYSKMFLTNPKLKCVLTNRIVLGEVVIDEEVVSINADNTFKALAMYRVRKGLITEVRFHRDLSN